jgi:Fur family peroxide stress response transcriptional regulator
VTPQRTLIYTELMTSDDHPTLETIYQRVRRRAPDISFDTVYRTLATFREIGLAQAVDGFGTRMRFDPKCEPHHHFRCVKCQAIVDFTDAEYDALEAPAAIRRRCEVTNVRVTVEGLCGKCKRGSSGKAKGKR